MRKCARMMDDTIAYRQRVQPGRRCCAKIQTCPMSQGDEGDCFLSSVQNLSLETSVALRAEAFGGQEVHDPALLSPIFYSMWRRL